MTRSAVVQIRVRSYFSTPYSRSAGGCRHSLTIGCRSFVFDMWVDSLTRVFMSRRRDDRSHPTGHTRGRSSSSSGRWLVMNASGSPDGGDPLPVHPFEHDVTGDRIAVHGATAGFGDRRQHVDRLPG